MLNLALMALSLNECYSEEKHSVFRIIMLRVVMLNVISQSDSGHFTDVISFGFKYFMNF
jgi:hypothetical protein